MVLIMENGMVNGVTGEGKALVKKKAFKAILGQYSLTFLFLELSQNFVALCLVSTDQVTTTIFGHTSGAAQGNFQEIFTDPICGRGGRSKYQTRLISADHLHDQDHAGHRRSPPAGSATHRRLIRLSHD